MKTSSQPQKDFDAVQFMRQQRDRLSRTLATMSKAEILQYFAQQTARRPEPSASQFRFRV